MTDAVGADIAVYPIHMSLLGAQAVMFEPQTSPNLVQQARLAMRQCWRGYGRGVVVILHSVASLPDNTLNLSNPFHRDDRRKQLLRAGIFRLTGARTTGKIVFQGTASGGEFARQIESMVKQMNTPVSAAK